jgi:hypothetical protein
MFTRWQKRKRKSPAFDGAQETNVQCAAIVVESAHVDGKPAQQQIASLGSITESAIEVPAQRGFFWRGAMKQLGQLAKRIKSALRHELAEMVRIEEGLAAKDRIPW